MRPTDGGSARRRVAVVIGLAVAVASADASAAAQATVRVDGRPVLRVSAAGGESADARARAVERRLSLVLERPDDASSPRVKLSAASADARVIEVSGVPVVTVTSTDAEESGTTVDDLSSRWADALARELTQSRGRRSGFFGRFVTEVAASTRAALSRLGESSLAIVPRALAASLVLCLFWLAARLVRALTRRVSAFVVRERTRSQLLSQLASYSVWVVGILVAADALGFAPSTVITGLGLTGLVLGFALKDVLSNVVSGVLLLALRAFRLGDQIVVGEAEGTVQRITLRATEILTYDGRLVLVPNAEVFTSRVVNNTAAPVRRASVRVAVGYDVEVERAITTISEVVRTTEGVLADRPVSVVVRELGAEDIVLEARFWTDSVRSDFLTTQSEVRRSMIAALTRAGVPLPDPNVRKIQLAAQQAP